MTASISIQFKNGQYELKVWKHHVLGFKQSFFIAYFETKEKALTFISKFFDEYIMLKRTGRLIQVTSLTSEQLEKEGCTKNG